VPGAGDTKTNFKWRLVQALLAEGLAVLTIDPPGHGDYRPRLLAYPDCLSAVPAALRFLREQPGISQVGLVGISLGGALALASLAAEPDRAGLGALVIIATPTELRYSKTLFYREVWGTLSRVPIITLFREMTVRQARQDWLTDGYRSRHSTAQLFDLLKPAESIARLAGRPILLVYSRRDRVAPPVMARAMHQAAPWATMIQSKKASHVTLILLPEINQQLSCWLKQTLA
jgi:pimeloyl-ACP methyl ester carboxylesterase